MGNAYLIRRRGDGQPLAIGEFIVNDPYQDDYGWIHSVTIPDLIGRKSFLIVNKLSDLEPGYFSYDTSVGSSMGQSGRTTMIVERIVFINGVGTCHYYTLYNNNVVVRSEVSEKWEMSFDPETGTIEFIVTEEDDEGLIQYTPSIPTFNSSNGSAFDYLVFY